MNKNDDDDDDDVMMIIRISDQGILEMNNFLSVFVQSVRFYGIHVKNKQY